MIATKLTALAGIVLILLFIWILSENKKKFPFRIVIWGLALQFFLAIILFYFPIGITFFQIIGDGIKSFLLLGLSSTDELLGNIMNYKEYPIFGYQLALIILFTIVFFSSFISLLYHYGIMQKIVYSFAWIMEKTMRTSGIESLSGASNVFIGQCEAPLLIKHYLSSATRSEVFSIMVCGFATIAGGVMSVYIQMGISPTILLSSSIISVPGALLLSKILIPPSNNTKTLLDLKNTIINTGTNPLDSLAKGANEGMRLSLSIIAMLIAFISFVAVIDACLFNIHIFLLQYNISFFPASMKELLGYCFQPFAYFLSIPDNEIKIFGQLLGIKTSLNEFIAYNELSTLIKNNAISERTIKLASFALCGFANFSSIAMQIGGIGALVPDKRSEIASLGLKAMLIGGLTNILTTLIASLFL